MKRETTLKENYEFRRAYRQGRSHDTPLLVLYARKNHGAATRLGITVSSKLGGAVVRNRVRRRLREIYRLSLPNVRRGYDLVVVARGRAVEAEYRELERDFRLLCAWLGLLEERGRK